MSGESLLKWLRKHPQSSKLRVTGLDGIVREVDLKGARLPRVVETLRSIKADVIEGLNADGSILKATTMAELDDMPPEDDDERQQQPQQPLFPRTALPPITAADPETQRYILTATLIANAYAHGYEVAFERLAQFVDGYQDRSQGLEQQRDAFHRMQIKQLESQLRAANIQPATEGDGLGMMMLQQFFGGMRAAPAQPAPNVANGHAEPEEVDGDA